MTASNVRYATHGLQVDAKPKRSPLAGWFGRRADDSPDNLPEMDVGAGVSRALRLASRAQSMGAPDGRRDAIREALHAIETALFTIDQVRDLIEQAYDLALSARETTDAAARSLLAESYDEIRLEMTKVADDVGADGSPLVGRQRNHIDVRLGGQALYTISAVRLDPSAKGLDLTPPRGAFEDDEEVNVTLEELDRALQKADRAAVSYCRDARFLIARLELEDRASA
ncbi:MAG: hypothetical protein GC152_15125 [Alphaproteobacteria bacterium]|nr:hypothetical protein [Alphaproteobacteria bacterium]